jgi:hypothetical protein
MLLRRLPRPLVVAACSPPDVHGHVSLGTNADYVAAFIGHVPFFVEVNRECLRTFGRNGIHLSQVSGWCESDHPLVEVAPAQSDDVDAAIAAAGRRADPDGSCIQAGIGAIRARCWRASAATASSASTPSCSPTV